MKRRILNLTSTWNPWTAIAMIMMMALLAHAPAAIAAGTTNNEGNNVAISTNPFITTTALATDPPAVNPASTKNGTNITATGQRDAGINPVAINTGQNANIEQNAGVIVAGSNQGGGNIMAAIATTSGAAIQGTIQ